MTSLAADPRYKTLDAWRGVACLMVVVFHSTLYCSARNTQSLSEPASVVISLTERFSIGVPMFFVISGYCIAAATDSARRKGMPLSTYAYRRFRRIFPPYWIALAVYIPIVAALELWLPGFMEDDVVIQESPLTLTAEDWFGTFTLTEGWLHNLTGGRENFFLGQAWTLGYEEQFYAVMGLLLAISRRYVFAWAAMVTAAVAALAPEYFNGFFFDGRWLQFAAGVGVYWALVHGNRMAAGAVALAIAIGFGLTARHLNFSSDPHDLEYPVAFGFALLLFTLRPWDSRLVSSPAIRPLNYCGEMCYSLYLMHWPLVKAISSVCWRSGFKSNTETLLVTVPICLIASLIAGRVFYHFVERRFLNQRA